MLHTIEMVKREGERRRRSDRQRALVREQVQTQMSNRVFRTPGAEAADHWLRALGLPVEPRWFVETSISAGDSRFDLNVYEEEWGFAFHHAGRGSWIRVTDVPFVHGRDDYGLLARTPDLLAIHALLAELEQAHAITFRIDAANVRSNVRDADGVVRDWLVQPPPYSTVKKTKELCGDEMHGIRCSLTKGHTGDHEYQGRDGRGQLRWK